MRVSSNFRQGEYWGDANEAGKLIDRADQAMCLAKSLGWNQYSLYRPE